MFKVPNILSLIRILLLPVMYYLVKNNFSSIYIVLTVCLIMLTDGLDGYLARKYKMVSNLGKILDPLADKVIILGTAFIAFFYRKFPLWAIGIIILRELFVVASILFIYKKNRVVGKANIFGKIMVVLLEISILMYLIIDTKKNIIPSLVLYTGLGFAVLSAFFYVMKYLSSNKFFLKNIILIVSLLIFCADCVAEISDYNYFLNSRIAIPDKTILDADKIDELLVRILWKKMQKNDIVTISEKGITIPLTQPSVECTYPMKRIVTDKRDSLKIDNKKVRVQSDMLKSTDFIISDNKKIKELIKEITKNERNILKAAILISNWIKRNIKYKPNMHLERVEDILEKKVTGFAGYSLLFITFLRAKGIPSKMVLGIKYKDDSFILHSWVKIYTGKWIQLDSASKSLFINPTYIIFFEGEEDIFNNAFCIDSIKVLDYK